MLIRKRLELVLLPLKIMYNIKAPMAKNALKSKKIFLIVILVAIFLSFAWPNLLVPGQQHAFAKGTDLEVKYPSLPGVDVPINTNSELPHYIKYIFILLTIISVIIIVIVLIYNGLLYAASTGSPTIMKNAKDGILYAVLGLIILITSVIVLVTVNPQLSVMKIKKVVPEKGVYLEWQDSGGNSSEDYIGVSIPDLENKFANISKVTGLKILNPQELAVTLYDHKNYNYDDNGKIIPSASSTTFKDRTDDSFRVLPAFWRTHTKSIRLKSIGPGVYLYGATLDKERYMTKSEPSLFELNNNVKQIKLEQLPNGATDFSAILHEGTNYVGQCEFIRSIVTGVHSGNIGENGKVYTLDEISSGYGKIDDVSSAHVFEIDDNKDNWNGSVTLCPNIDYKDDTDSGINCVTIDKNSFGGHPFFRFLSLKDINLENKVRSIKVDGKFVVALLEKDPSSGKTGECEVFMPYSKFPDLSKEPINKCRPHFYSYFFASFKPCATYFTILPIK